MWDWNAFRNRIFFIGSDGSNSVENTSTNNRGINVQNQRNLPSRVNKETVTGMHLQVQTSTVETSLSQSNVVSTKNTLPFSTTRPWGMPPLSNEMNIPQLSLPMPQNQNIIPPICS